jgi:serine/threonine protein kinase
MAPELFSITSEKAQYTSAADIYSFGIIFNAMYRGCQPFNEADFNGVLHLLRSVEKGELTAPSAVF